MNEHVHEFQLTKQLKRALEGVYVYGAANHVFESKIFGPECFEHKILKMHILC